MSCPDIPDPIIVYNIRTREEGGKNVADWVKFDFVTKEEGCKQDPDFSYAVSLMYKHNPHRIIIQMIHDIESMASIITHETIHCVLFELFYPLGEELTLAFDDSLASAVTKFGCDIQKKTEMKKNDENPF